MLALRRSASVWQRTLTRCPRFYATGPPKSAFYITTPIFYVNGAPHIGHLYSSVIADIIARWERFKDPSRPVQFVTGSDEHGLKVQKAAADANQGTQEFCDKNSDKFRGLMAAGNISHTRFIRTTEPAHKRAVEHLWNDLLQRGHIYKGTHEGWYSITDECFYTNGQVEERVDPLTGSKTNVAIETGSVVEWSQEENYKFRLSAFSQPLLKWLKDTAGVIHPESRHAEVIGYLRPSTETDSLQDISISRPASRLQWGIPVPGDPDHTIYVWLDALTSYLTAVGYPWVEPAGPHQGGWPADIHLVGKDILRFHTIIWPAVLLALDIPLPRKVIAHAHWTVDRQKMSKSVGNVVDPFEMMNKYGVDAVRFYLAQVGGGLLNDADWSQQQFEKHYDWDLAATLGNLHSRIHSAKILTPEVYDVEPVDIDALTASLQILPQQVSHHMANLEINRALDTIFDVLREANRHLTLAKPWEAGARQKQTTVAFVRETLRLSALLLQPFLPSTARQLLDDLGVLPGFRTMEYARAANRNEQLIGPPVSSSILFPRRKENASKKGKKSSNSSE